VHSASAVRRNFNLGDICRVGDLPKPVADCALEEFLYGLAVCLNRRQQRRDSLGVHLRHRCERIERRQYLVGFFFRDIDHDNRHLLIRGRVSAE
jgi:hypothetical protein